MLKFRRYQPSDKEQCLALLQTGHDVSFDRVRYEWLHERSLEAPSEIAVCLEGKRIVGFYAAVRKRVRWQDRILMAARDIDPVVSPDCRGQGVFTRLLEFGLENFEDIDFLFNFANPASAPGFLKKGWERIGYLRDYVCQLGFGRVLTRDCLLYFGTGARVRRRPLAGVRRVEWADLNVLLLKVPTPPTDRIWVVRSPEYLRWRYADHPLHNYTYFLDERDGGVSQFCVCRYQRERNELYILDLVDFDGRGVDIARFLPILREYFPRAWTCVWSATPAGCRRHFLTKPWPWQIGQPLLVRRFPGREIPAPIETFSRWFLTHGDLEIT